jgi:hypothetical protein
MQASTSPRAVQPNPAPGTQRRPSGPNGWLVIGGVFTAVLIASGALAAAGWLGFRTETQHQVYRAQLTNITIEVDTGDVTLMPGESGVVDVERRLFWSYEKPIVEERWDGRTLRVSSDCPGWFQLGPGCGVDYTLQVPEGVSVRAHTSTGDVSVRNIDGDLHLTTSTGDITVTDAAGALQLRTSTGDIRASNVTSETVDASTSTGNITLDLSAAPRTVAAQTSTGDIRVIVPDGDSYQVQAETSTGDTRISVRQDDAASRSIVARASTGDIDISY